MSWKMRRGFSEVGPAKIFHGRDGAIFDVYDAVSEICDAAVVSDNRDGAVVIMCELAHEFEYGAAGMRIECGSGLVGKQDFRASGKGPGQCDTLLLSSAEVSGIGGGLVVEVDLLKQTEGLGASELAADAFEFQCDFDIFNRGERGKQIEGLEDEANVAEPDLRQFALAEAGHLLTGDLKTAGGGAENTAHDGEERGFAATGGPHQEEQLSFVEIEINAFKRRDTRGAFGVDLSNSADSNGYFHNFPLCR